MSQSRFERDPAGQTLRSEIAKCGFRIANSSVGGFTFALKRNDASGIDYFRPYEIRNSHFEFQQFFLFDRVVKLPRHFSVNPLERFILGHGGRLVIYRVVSESEI